MMGSSLRSWAAWPALAGVAVVAGLVSGCGAGFPPVETDLTGPEIPISFWASVEEMDPVDAPHALTLLEGWTGVERKTGQRVIYSQDRSALLFYAAEAQHGVVVQLAFRKSPEIVAPFDADVSLNGRWATTVEVRQKWGRHRFKLPAEALVEGLNVLRVDIPEPVERRQRFGPQRVQWGPIHWRWPAGVVPKASLERQDGAVSLPVPSRLDHHLELPAEAVVALDSVRLAPGSELLVEWVGLDGRSAELLRVIESGSRDLRSEPIGGEGLQRGRISLSAVRVGPTVGGPTAEAANRPILRLHGARIVTPGIEEDSPPVEAPRPPDPAASRPHVIVYLVDTLRNDHLGAYGDDRGLSPHLDRFAEGAFVFEDSQAQSSWTRSSVASILSGLYPRSMVPTPMTRDWPRRSRPWPRCSAAPATRPLCSPPTATPAATLISTRVSPIAVRWERPVRPRSTRRSKPG